MTKWLKLWREKEIFPDWDIDSPPGSRKNSVLKSPKHTSDRNIQKPINI